MKITWYGWASFGVESESGLRIVTDPYDPAKSGFKPFPDKADIIVISSDNDDFHDNAHLVPKSDGAEVVNALDLARSGTSRVSHGMEIKAVLAKEHLSHHEHDPEDNGMYRFEVDGIDFGHMGDIGNPFTKQQIDFFEGVDILFALAGGYPVVEMAEVKRVADAIKPRYVVPMHFRTLCYLRREGNWITEFLKFFPEEMVDFAFSSSIELKRENLPDHTRGLVMDYI